MSLVDYAASSDEDEPRALSHEEGNEQVKESPERRPRIEVPVGEPSSAAPANGDPVDAHNRMSKNLGPPSIKQTDIVSNKSSELKLPDASLLLNSPAMSSNSLNALDHSSRVAAAMAESAARKRDLNGLPASYPRNKVPKGILPHSKNVPDTAGSHLLPPQLAGRSNIVTEDISKLFVRKHTNSSAEYMSKLIVLLQVEHDAKYSPEDRLFFCSSAWKKV